MEDQSVAMAAPVEDQLVALVAPVGATVDPVVVVRQATANIPSGDDTFPPNPGVEVPNPGSGGSSPAPTRP
ncbi:hypothetical protein RHMOL_Rhmol06G0210600 [Rhododendron molle]|uniref:Uncharacterized protein n=1 Tax=Rhododendron molle TaxID=49168 RepID=A0ACC0NEG2_RHOML|nr:hypothetical protein RHMOL_Rhmol06G0210600 [Rhododendron molle]